MNKFINFDLMSHPLNWFTVTLMVLVGGIALHFILQYQGAVPANQQ